MEQFATGRIPGGLAGMLALVAVVEAFIATRDVATTTHLVDSWTQAWASAASGEVRTSEILCLGDSQIQQALHPAAFDVPAYNLAVQGGQPATSHALLRCALDSGARPRAIVVGFFPGLLGADLRINRRLWPEVLGPIGAADLAWRSCDVDLGVRTLLALALGSYRARDEIRSEVAARLRHASNSEAAVVLADRRSRRENRGALIRPEIRFVDDAAPPGPASDDVGWAPRPEHVRSLRRLLSLAESRGIAVYWVTTTLSPGARARREHSGLHAGYLRFLRRLAGEFPGLTVLDVDGLGLDLADFHDPCHVRADVAGELTRAVARAMARRDRAGGWVRLAPADDPTQVAVDHTGDHSAR